MTGYSFVTRWRAAAPAERVWDAIIRSDEWPQWWRAVTRVQVLAPGDPQTGIGRDIRLTWRTQLPYGFTFDVKAVRIEPYQLLEGQARGDLEGMGLWTLTRDGDGTLVQYDWNVRTNKGWMNALAPLLRPAFAYNHNVVMRWGKEGLAKRLGVRVTEVSEG